MSTVAALFRRSDQRVASKRLCETAHLQRGLATDHTRAVREHQDADERVRVVVPGAVRSPSGSYFARKDERERTQGCGEEQDVHWDEVDTSRLTDRANDLRRRPSSMHERGDVLSKLTALERREVRGNRPLVDHLVGKDVAAELSHTLEREEREKGRHADGRDPNVVERQVLERDDALGLLAAEVRRGVELDRGSHGGGW